MSNPNFPQTNGPFDAQINPNLNPNNIYTDDFLFDNYLYNHQEFENYNNYNEGSTSGFSNAYLSQSTITQEMTSNGSVDGSLDGLPENTNIISRSQGVAIRAADVNDEDDEHRVVAFRIKTEIDLDDGYKWRKYGKKKVKSNANPRNYYKCNTGRCTVKKRVEKDPQDPSYVLISYEGAHNHPSPTYIIHTQNHSDFTRVQ
ncbi:hypothetical protein Leryth_014678 [Lithospermum erythrorhizon]|nr:hypothetical protein Leryth_014678 [Lithospermum erythrorhizon]